MKVDLITTAKLEFQKNGLAATSSYQRALDDPLKQDWGDCAVSESSKPTIWLSIDLGYLYSVNKIRMASRLNFGIGSEVYVGKNAIKSDGTSDHQCGSSVGIPNPAPSTLTNFPCSSVNWVQYVSIRRHEQTGWAGQFLQVCKVEVYYDENEGKNVTRTWLANYFLFI